MTIRIVLCSSPNRQVSEQLARALVENKLVACAQVLPGMRSFYWWEGKVADESEELLVLKTFEKDLPALEKLVHDLHPYQVPELIVLNPSHVAPKYAAWMQTALER